jgi:low temperature requirement protein LtrA
MLLGIIAIAAAEQSSLAHPFSALSWPQAALLSGGAAVFLAGDALFRSQLSIGPRMSRVTAALLALAVMPLGAEQSAATQIAVLVVLLGAAIAFDHRADA